MIEWAPMLVSIFNASMCRLYGLLRERDVATRNGVQIRLVGRNLGVHDNLQFVEPIHGRLADDLIL